MKILRIALAQINPTVGDFQGNCCKILRYIHQAEEQQADLICFPELALTGYPPEDLLLRPAFIKANLDALHTVVRETKDSPVASVIGFVDHHEDIFNSAAVIYGGGIQGIYHKMYLPNYGVFDEFRYFKGGETCKVFEIHGVTCGLSICEDIWYPDGPTLTQAVMGKAEVVINISASPFQAGKFHQRQRMLATRASDNTLLLAYVNMVGGQDELVFDGGSMVIDQEGEILALAGQFREELLVVDLPVDAVFRDRLRDPRNRTNRRSPDSSCLQDVDHIRIPARNSAPPARPPLAIQKARESTPEEEVYRALICGTGDYVDKNGFHTVVIGLSGGIDSALVACIASDALGPQRVVGVSMPSLYTSEASREDARVLAANLGIRFLEIPIDGVMESYDRALAEAFRGRAEDVTEENIQARIRGNYLMALSNKFGWLVLTTGNKSEMGVGYCTLYGDMAGGFAVIKDVPKTLVQRLASLRNASPENSPIPLNTLTRPPSAELRPNQLDSDSLPPYATLDPILIAYVEEERGPDEIAAMGFDPALVRKVLRMIDRNEYKRRQGPPGIKITSRAFGRDRRMPITNRSPY